MSLKDLKKVKEDDVQGFTLKGLKKKVKVVRVIDGDTLDVVFYLNDDNLVRFTCRMLGYNAPERKKKTMQFALLARDYLAHLCMGYSPDDFDDSGIWEEDHLQRLLDESRNLVYAVFGDFDNFGRALVALKTSARGESINNLVSEFVNDL